MIALSVVKKYAETTVHWLKMEVLQKSGFGGIKGGTDLRNLSVELFLRYHMSDPCMYQILGRFDQNYSRYREQNICNICYENTDTLK